MRRAYLSWLVLAIVVMASAGFTAGTRAQVVADYAPFIGHYTGEVMVETPTGPAKRELDVLVRQEIEGFSVEWTTDTVRPDGRIKSETYFIAFKPTPRPGIYIPTNEVRRKGSTVRIDPLYGDPQLLLCKIEGATMTIHASQLMEDGVFEVQTYERTLVPGGMRLKFSRVRNGEPTRAIEAELKKD